MHTHCADCGAEMDAFGLCPNADPADAAIMTAPVNCGHLDRIKSEAQKIIEEVEAAKAACKDAFGKMVTECQRRADAAKTKDDKAQALIDLLNAQRMLHVSDLL